MNIIGYFHGIDPAACLVRDGRLVSFCEEERLIRYKHAPGLFPVRSIEWCLKSAGLSLRDIDCFAYGWDAPAYGDGTMARFYERVNAADPPDPGTASWQKRNLTWFHPDSLVRELRSALFKHFGEGQEAKLIFEPHHRSHAATGFFLSPMDEALVFVVDGSGDSHCATLWHGAGAQLELLHAVEIPNSLGWFYAAMTEYLGFEAYDGEYKVMGLAAYGRPNERLRRAIAQVIHAGSAGWDYVVEPKYIHHGRHTFSHRFTDDLVKLLDLKPRMGPSKLTSEHEDLAFETQLALEEHALRLVRHFAKKTGLRNLCMAGGVALNVKMNSRIHREGLFDEMFIFPIPSDSGTGIGAAVAHAVRTSGRRAEALRHVYLGPSYGDAEIELQLQSCGLAYEKYEDIAEPVAELLAQDQVVGWFQGGLEGGPRALGARSILADPRDIKARDRVNAAIKFREYWRPFCPSITEEAAGVYLRDACPAPFMILAFEATEEAKDKAPAIVHVDGTVRVQTVGPDTNPPYHRLLKAFERRTGVPVLLNTSFNIKGEAIVGSPRDALRTFFSTGIDALAIGSYLVKKPRRPMAIRPEEVLR
jgi:carbamoyltransferase